MGTATTPKLHDDLKRQRSAESALLRPGLRYHTETTSLEAANPGDDAIRSNGMGTPDSPLTDRFRYARRSRLENEPTDRRRYALDSMDKAPGAFFARQTIVNEASFCGLRQH